MKTQLFRKSISVFVLLLVGLCVMAGNPNFSGNWKLDKAKSTLSTQYSFAPSSLSISQTDNNIEVSRTINLQGSEMNIIEKATLDGKECKNEGYQGSSKLTTAVWSEKGTSLTVTNKIGGMEMTSVQVYSFEGDLLTIQSSYSSSYGDMKETWVLAKE